MMYISLVIMQINAARKAGEVSESAMEALLAQPLTLLSSRVVIEPPSTTQEEEIEGMEPEIMDDDRPLTRYEKGKMISLYWVEGVHLLLGFHVQAVSCP
jgi:hypothetical protein